jgi:hypothetical protein
MSIRFKIKYAFPVLIFLSLAAHSQQLGLPLNRGIYLKLERSLSGSDEAFHTGFKPILEQHIPQENLDHVFKDTNTFYYDFTYFVCKRNLFVIDKPNLYATIDPLFNFEIGRDLHDTLSRNYTKNTRGFIVRANIGKKVSFMSSFYENQGFFPQYIIDYATERSEYLYTGSSYVHNVGFGMIPGQGRAKPFKEWGYDYAMASGYVSFSPRKELNIQFGHDKNFVGDGYRSLLLSDNAFNYPFLKLTTTWLKGRVQYTNLFNSLQSMYRLRESTSPEATFERKAGSFRYLSINVTKKLQLGLFEGVIWKRMDSLTGTTPVDYSMFMPVIFVNTLSYKLNEENNVLVGANIKYRPLDKLTLYGQVVLDQLEDGKHGFQVGARYLDAFGIDHLHLQAEYNSVAPYTYSHQTPLQNYSHFGQPLAHPMGSGFNEIVAIANYQRKRFFGELKVNYSTYDDYGDVEYGKDIFLADNDVIIAVAPEKANLSYQDLRIGYFINPKTNMNINIGVLNRILTQNSAEPHNTTYLYVGFRTSLTNNYYDF